MFQQNKKPIINYGYKNHQKDIKRDFNYMFTVSKNMKDFKQNPVARLCCEIIKIFTPML